MSVLVEPGRLADEARLPPARAQVRHERGKVHVVSLSGKGNVSELCKREERRRKERRTHSRDGLEMLFRIGIADPPNALLVLIWRRRVTSSAGKEGGIGVEEEATEREGEELVVHGERWSGLDGRRETRVELESAASRSWRASCGGRLKRRASPRIRRDRGRALAQESACARARVRRRRQVQPV